VTSHPTVAAATALLDRRYPPGTAEEWDAVGLVCGRLEWSARRVLFAVDPTPEVVAEAIGTGVNLLVTHHPLFLRGVHEVAAVSWKGRVVHDLIEHQIALFCAHTNADVAPGGVNDALALALGLTDIAPLLMTSAGSASDDAAGLGRIGTLPAPQSLAQFAERVRSALPATQAGIRVAGDLSRQVERIAVCGGAGDSLLDRVHEVGAEVFVTADLRHHLAGESMIDGGPALVDPGHWASEWPWLPVAAQRLADDAAVAGTTVEVAVSSLVTDPWSGHLSFES